MDKTINANGVDIIYSKHDEGYLDHSIIDFEDSFMGSGFVVRSMLPGSC